MEGFNLILSIMHVFICFFNGVLSGLDLNLIFDGIDTSTLKFLVFKTLNTVFVLFTSESLDSVRPIFNTSVRFFLEGESFHGTLFLIKVVSHWTLLFYSFQLIDRYDSCGLWINASSSCLSISGAASLRHNVLLSCFSQELTRIGSQRVVRSCDCASLHWHLQIK